MTRFDIYYPSKARRYLREKTPTTWPLDVGMNGRQLSILGRLISFGDYKNLIERIDADDLVPPCAVDEFHPTPQIGFFTVLNPRVRGRGQARIEKRLKNLAEKLGFKKEFLRSLPDVWYGYELEFNEEGINWYMGFCIED